MPTPATLTGSGSTLLPLSRLLPARPGLGAAVGAALALLGRVLASVRIVAQGSGPDGSRSPQRSEHARARETLAGRVEGRSSPSEPDRSSEGAQASGASVVLVVDDSPLNRQLLCMVVTQEGYRTVEASDGQEAVEAARRQRPDLVLMDLLMPRKDGFQATAEIRQHPDAAEVPIVAVTALALSPDDDRVKAARFDDYLVKPIHPRTIQGILTRFLGAPSRPR